MTVSLTELVTQQLQGLVHVIDRTRELVCSRSTIDDVLIDLLCVCADRRLLLIGRHSQLLTLRHLCVNIRQNALNIVRVVLAMVFDTFTQTVQVSHLPLELLEETLCTLLTVESLLGRRAQLCELCLCLCHGYVKCGTKLCHLQHID